MRKTLGIFAIIFMALAPIGAWAQTSSGPAPADEYFGPHHQSVLEIRNRLDSFDRKSDAEMLDSSVVTAIDDLNTSITDWQHHYPNDPWLPHAMARLMRCYHRAGAASSARAQATLDLMRGAYPDSEDTSATVAMIFGGSDLPGTMPVVTDAWARFDAMRADANNDSGGP
ncbi:MAG TPA: hypothetical protein VNF68_08445 [Candidatus Baltobacteraceae bacterium]|nr:hypothetical protein [Candidatus Baltobacteraceae bacterium]